MHITQTDYDIKKAISVIRDYISILKEREERQTDIADKIPFERMIEDLAMASFELQSHLISRD